MTTMTTIKVPRELRDRIAGQARLEGKTLAEVIARALDKAEEQAFWAAVHRAHAQISDEERAERLNDHTLMDGLNDPNDDEISRRNDW